MNHTHPKIKETCTERSRSVMVQTIGTAVYKARSMWATYEPAFMYDDIKLCNNPGVYKNRGNNNGLFTKENEYLKSLKRNEAIPILGFGDFIIYPNPANNIINIKYNIKENEKACVIIYDIVGRERLKINLKSNINQVSININTLETGIYCYKYLVENNTTHTGKLIIE